nr:hypothetical protein [Tanacetum cinerariifolium]
MYRHLSSKDSSQNSPTERCCQKAKPYSRRSCSDYAYIFQSFDVSMGRSCGYCVLHPKPFPNCHSPPQDPYELVHNKNPDLTFSESLVHFAILQTTAKILENFNQQLTLEYLLAMLQAGKGIESTTKGPDVFDELTEPIAPVHLSTGPAPTFMTPGQISSGLVPNPVPATPYAPPTNKELEILFQPMFDEYLESLRAERPGSPAQAVQVSVTSAGTPLSTTIDQDAPSPHISPSSLALQSHSLPPGVVAEPHFIEDHNVAPIDNNPFVNVFAPEPHSKASSSGDISSTESPYVSQTLHHLNK